MRLKHLRAYALHDGDASQERGSDVKRYDWMLGRGRERSLSSNGVIEVRDNDTKYPVTPEFGVARKWPGHSALQQKAGKFQRRCSGLDAAFCIIVWQLLTTKCCVMILIE